MPKCTFFGHRDCPDTIKPRLREVIRALIEDKGVDTFFVGNQGSFDSMVRKILREMCEEYPHIKYSVVLAYMPKESDKFEGADYSDTILPEGIETVHPRYAISKRNTWMLKQADYVVTYVIHSFGGAAKFAETAKKQKKRVINVAMTAEI